MKTFKIIAVTVIISGALFIAGSTYAALILPSCSPFTPCKTTPEQKQIIEAQNKKLEEQRKIAEEEKKKEQERLKKGCLTISDQIKMGFKYDMCTGEKLPASFNADQVEARFQAIEARLNKLESKK